MKLLGRLFGTPSQMSCRQVGKVLQTYLDDELDDDTARKVAAHLEDCRRCGLEAETYEALKESLWPRSGRLGWRAGGQAPRLRRTPRSGRDRAPRSGDEVMPGDPGASVSFRLNAPVHARDTSGM